MSDLSLFQLKTLSRMGAGRHPYGATSSMQGRGHVSKALRALHQRGYVTEPHWDAVITDSGREYLAALDRSA